MSMPYTFTSPSLQHNAALSVSVYICSIILHGQGVYQSHAAGQILIQLSSTATLLDPQQLSCGNPY